jgi:peroxiredoxin
MFLERPKRVLSRKVIGALAVAGISVSFIVSRIALAPRADRQADGQVYARVNAPAPPFVLERAGGGVLTLDQFAGRPMLIGFWATWCAECQEHVHWLNERQRNFGDRGLVVLAVHRTRTELQSAADQFASGADLSVPVLYDRTDEVYQTYVKGGRHLPAAVLIDRRGVVRKVYTGDLDEETLEADLGRYSR